MPRDRQGVPKKGSSTHMYVGARAFQNFLGRSLTRPDQGLQNPLDTLARIAGFSALVHWLVYDDVLLAANLGRIALFFGSVALCVAFETGVLIWANGRDCFLAGVADGCPVTKAVRTHRPLFLTHRLVKEQRVLLGLQTNTTFKLIVKRTRHEHAEGWHREKWERLEVHFRLEPRNGSRRLSEREAAEVADWLLRAFLELQRDTIWREVTDVHFLQRTPSCIQVLGHATLQRWPNMQRYMTTP